MDGHSQATTRASSAGINRKPKKVERSCILCHRRKIRCDKRLPCSTCTKTGVLCCYPAASEQTVRRPRKTTIADVAERLGQLERTLVAISSTGSDSPAHNSAHSPVDHGPQHQLSKDDGAELENASVAEEFLLNSGDTSQYMNEILISRILEEENELRSALGAHAQPEGADTEETSFQFPVLGLLNMCSPDTPQAAAALDLHPTKWQAMQLWETFVKNVDILHKVLHLPTTQITVYQAIEGPLEAGPEVNCLLFAIYFSSVTALTDDAVSNMLGYDKRRALETFKRALDIYLAQANFLESPTMITLQAMSLFMKTVRAHNTGRSVWVLNGLVVRAARSFGLHRDGTTLGLPIFESELRRRLWLSIKSSDTRAAEDHGIMVSNFDPWDNIGDPSNVDDAELYPGMTETPENRPRWTEMSLSLIIKEYCEVQSRLQQMLPPLRASMPPEAARREMVERSKADCERQYFQYCNPVIPAQRAAMLMGRVMMGKLDFISRLQWLSMANQNTTRGLVQTDEETFVEACQILEYASLIRSDELLRNYRWIVELYPSYHMLLYVMWRLCIEPTGPSVERAWKAVDAAFEPEYAKMGLAASPPGSKWTVLKNLREKAKGIREKTVNAVDTSGVGPSSTVNQSYGSTEVVAQPSGGEIANEAGLDHGLHWDGEDGDLPDWNDLVEDLRMTDGFDIHL